MKSLLIIFLSFSCAFGSMAQATVEVADTISSQELGEIVIQAPRVVRKADMDVYYPSAGAVSASRSGMQLLRNLMIPSLSVDDMLGSVKAAGESVQIRINGRESTVDQLRALLSETIKRVEWIDNPGLRYGGARYVLNVIVRNPSAGGSLQTEARQALTAGWGLYTADTKFNSGYSQWQVSGMFKESNRIRSYRDYTETFTFPSGETLRRDETSLGGTLDNSFGGLGVGYSYVKPDTTVVMIDLDFSRKFSDRSSYRGLLSVTGDPDPLELTDIQGNKGSTPSLSLYWQQNFTPGRMLILSFNSSYYVGRTFSDYIEGSPESSARPLTAIHTDIRDRNQAYALEVNYVVNWNNSRFTAGASYKANRNHSEYRDMADAVFHQRQDKIYAFAEYFRRMGKWSVTAGMGMQYTSFLFRESSRGNHSWSPRPQATLTYSPSQAHSLRLSFTSWQATPALMETNVVPQQIDGFQWRVGNQNLKTSSSYMLIFQYGFNAPRFNGSFGIRAFTSPDAITPLIFWWSDASDHRLVTTYENSRGLQNLSFFLAPQVEIVPDWLMASGYLQYRAERMRGTGYSLHNAAWSGNATVRLAHWDFELLAQYQRAQRDLWGEKIAWGEDHNIIQLGYNYRAWQFSAGVIMPFGRYDKGSRSLSRWNRNEQHMRLDMRMPYISVNWNLQWGRQRRDARKLVNVDASTDRSTAGGR